jgi:hypothetical protein
VLDAGQSICHALQYGGDPVKLWLADGVELMRLLLVEDNEKLRPALKKGLAETGAVRIVAECATGEEALELALHTTMMAVVGGSLTSESVPGAYTRIRLSLPLSVASSA